MTTEYKPYTISEIVTRIYEDNYSHFDFMDNIIHWDDANWTIEENVYLPELGEWHTR